MPGSSENCLRSPTVSAAASSASRKLPPAAKGASSAVEQLVHHLLEVLAADLAGEHLAAPGVDHAALLVHDVVVLEQLLADLEVVGLDPLLGVLDGAGDEAVLDRLALLHADLAHQPADAVRAEDPHQVVLEREEEARGPGVALAPGAAAQLVVDAAALVALGADDVQAARGDHLLVLLVRDGAELGEDLLVGAPLGPLRGEALAGERLGVAPEQDVGAAAGHVGRDRDRGVAAGLGDDLGLALVVLGVEHLVADPLALEQGREVLGLLDRDRADQRRAAGLGARLDLADDGVELLALGAVDQVLLVDAPHRAVGRDGHDVHLVGLVELRRLGVGGAGHAGELACRGGSSSGT